MFIKKYTVDELLKYADFLEESEEEELITEKESKKLWDNWHKLFIFNLIKTNHGNNTFIRNMIYNLQNQCNNETNCCKITNKQFFCLKKNAIDGYYLVKNTDCSCSINEKYCYLAVDDLLVTLFYNCNGYFIKIENVSFI